MITTYTKEIGELTAVLYSPEQKCFHLEPLKEYINNNLQHAIARIKYNQFHLIGICENDEVGDAYIAKIRFYQENFNISNMV